MMPIVYSRLLRSLLFLLPVNYCSAAIIYVNINNPAPGAGSSWAGAYNDLTAALASAYVGDEVWVARGTYKPTATNDRTLSFIMKSGVAVYGGFTGTETFLSARNWKTNPTILSGDIGLAGNPADNTYTIVRFETTTAATLLDGFIIRDGNANQNYPATTFLQPYNQAGGIRVYAGTGTTHATVMNCTLKNNFGVYGGGICNYSGNGGSLTNLFVYNCVFDNNTALLGGGIGVVGLAGGTANTYSQNCLFVNNSSTGSAGSAWGLDGDGINSTCHTEVTNCTFYNNGDFIFFNLLQNSGASRLQVANSIVTRAGPLYNNLSVVTGPVPAGSGSFLTYSDLYQATPGATNINTDPLFIDAANGYFSVLPCSPVIDQGTNAPVVLPTDINGTPRIQGPVVDMGIYETLQSLTPLPAGVQPITYCQFDAADPLTATGTDLRWYTSATGGTGDVTAPVPATVVAGTTIYYVTQTDANGCESDRAMQEVVVQDNPVPAFSITGVCAGHATSIAWLPASPVPDNYSWTFDQAAAVKGAGGGPYQVTWNTNGAYTVQLTTTTGTCSNYTEQVVNILPAPVVNITAVPAVLCAGSSIVLQATGAVTYQWSPAVNLSSATDRQPTVLLQQPVTYTVTGTAANGCTDTAAVTLQVSKDCLGYYLPNAFSPDNNGVNDVFRVKSIDTPRAFDLRIFNRWGQEVFHSTDVLKGWNGQAGSNKAPAGTYICTVQITTSAGTVIKKQGSIILIR